ncbi:hypothetical protein [Absidia glauca]|uniref:F-box domain-containing protein n=1 Tax=Absidia glauca TaxID=4829 RepID=A0A163J7R9_ABSGL|nr:hypothetical protein [Absidia glauca]
MTYLSDVPIEVLRLILSNINHQTYLYECALVNKNWYAVTNPLLWREPMFFAAGAYRKEMISYWLSRAFRQAPTHGLHATPLGHYIRRLSILLYTNLQDMRHVINNVPLVEQLSIEVKTLTNVDIYQIALKCPKLKRLSLRYQKCYSGFFDSSDDFFTLLQLCTNLRELSINTNFRTTCLLSSLKHDRLEKLRLITSGSPRRIPLGLTFSNIPTLTNLDLDSLAAPYFRHYRTLPSPTFFPGLTRLRISMLYGAAIDNEAVVSFFKAHPLIDTLTIQSMKIDSAIMTSLTTDLVHLKRLTLIDNGCLPPFTMALPLLERLDLRHCSMNVPSTVYMATLFPNIHYIYVSKRYDPVLRKSSNIMGDDSQSDKLTIESLTQLKYLNFASYDSVPVDLKVNVPRRIGGKLAKADWNSIQRTAVGLAIIC